MTVTELDDSLRQVAITTASALTTKGYGDAITFTLLAYDYVVTIDVELAHIWRQRFTGATAFFLLNRYLFLLSVCLKWIFRYYTSNNYLVCAGLGISIDFLDFDVIATTVKLIFTLRTWAIWMRSWRVLVCISLLGIGKVGMNIAAWSNTTSYLLTAGLPAWNYTLFIRSCEATRRANTFPEFNMASQYIGLGFDTVVCCLTVGKTIQSVRRMRELGIHRSVTYFIFRDGSTVALTLIQMLLALRSPSSPSPAFTVSVVSGAVVTATGNIVINRMLLNLRQVVASDVDLNHVSISGISQEGITFATNAFLGNLGAPMCMSDACGGEVMDPRDNKSVADNVEPQQ
ncbi:hypothetical protein BD410DRAFT_789993 [Rickenella mellea]|uniref:DUF6533 domain-containing protein n=1 Tax=Rickenella mellea TaxID=50990 RepID=A0A4Y7Q1E2_9AGAM|nr:hypothetical protein BD410DRAFT_789993 [Rickenella mellea]